ncbi:hypothetical protein Pla100_51930 [Neorhodopirellula pilleata]|uniref:Uncharacterized protein n=1 Tax=Neorhodopirellula pilleata TaxID=2714738 RepID=A0A5C5ZW59_9BACT|nr:hypothetical protein Pla100_51930 [Neorhodopirellula pilleata]
MLFRLLILICASACLASGTALAQLFAPGGADGLDVRIELVRQKGVQHPEDDRDRLENLDLSITIVNGTSAAIVVPETYPNFTRIRLCASGSMGTRIPLHLFRHMENDGMMGAGTIEPRIQKTVTIAPGKTYELLRVSAKDTLISPGCKDAPSRQPPGRHTDRVENFAERPWGWGWRAHPRPDYSPFESQKGDRRTETAVLWFEMEIDGFLVRSVPQLVTLR